MNFIALLKDAWHILRSDDYKVVSHEELQKRREDSARSICAKLSRGNILLQQGKYITDKQFKENKKRIFTTDT